MLKLSAKNRKLYLVYKNPKIELQAKLSKILLAWFFAQRQVKTTGASFFWINHFTKFLTAFLVWTKFLGLAKSIWIFDYIPTMKKITQNFKNLVIHLNLFLFSYRLETLLQFYRKFLKYCLFLDVNIIGFNTLTYQYLESYLVKLNNPNLSYIYNVVTNLNYNSSYSRINTACFVTGRGRAVLKAFKLSRFKTREFANLGLFVGLAKSSW